MLATLNSFQDLFYIFTRNCTLWKFTLEVFLFVSRKSLIIIFALSDTCSLQSSVLYYTKVSGVFHIGCPELLYLCLWWVDLVIVTVLYRLFWTLNWYVNCFNTSIMCRSVCYTYGIELMYDHHKRCFETWVISQLYVVCLLRDRNNMLRNGEWWIQQCLAWD